MGYIAHCFWCGGEIQYPDDYRGFTYFVHTRCPSQGNSSATDRRTRPAAAQTVPKSIYLAGKIAKNDWRHGLVPGLRAAWGSDDGRYWGPWPVLPNAIGTGSWFNWKSRTTGGGYFDYTGPYFAEDDHGCWHSTSHACTEWACGMGGWSREQVRDQCLNAIQRSDLVFAWIDGLTGYGTLAEIGFARALGKEILIASPEPPGVDSPLRHDGAGAAQQGLSELWLAFSLASHVIRHTDPVACILELAERFRAAATPQHQFRSPIEQKFWDAHQRLAHPALAGLVPQHPVGKYFIDFALPDRKVGIELDGLATHSSTAAIAKDRQRQRALEAAGWRVVRFGGSEVHHDAERCVRQAAELIRKWSGDVS